MNNLNRMRDPAGNDERYAEFFRSANSQLAGLEDNFPTVALNGKINIMLRKVNLSEEFVLHQYGQGDQLETVKKAVAQRLPVLKGAQDFLRTCGPALNPKMANSYVMDGTDRLHYAFAAFILLLDADGPRFAHFRELITPAERDTSSYLFHLLIKAFIPEYELGKKCESDKYRAPWTDPVLRVLAQPGERRAAAMAAHMKSWPRLMRPHGWKPDLDTRPGKDRLFCDFAFEVALAVCAYDIDDSSFAGHPYYPSDLVAYYRKYVRGTRDAWRSESVGAGVQVIAPPLPKKADLAKSKRKNFARWVELACDGDVTATESVLEEVGKPRHVNNLDQLLEALFEQVIDADIKDDDAVEIQAIDIASARGLGEYPTPSGPPFGPVRCAAILRDFAQWLTARGYRLVDLNNDDDAWHAVAVKNDYHNEFLTLSSQLGIVTREPDDVYDI